MENITFALSTSGLRISTCLLSISNIHLDQNLGTTKSLLNILAIKKLNCNGLVPEIEVQLIHKRLNVWLRSSMVGHG